MTWWANSRAKWGIWSTLILALSNRCVCTFAFIHVHIRVHVYMFTFIWIYLHIYIQISAYNACTPSLLTNSLWPSFLLHTHTHVIKQKDLDVSYYLTVCWSRHDYLFTHLLTDLHVVAFVKHTRIPTTERNIISLKYKILSDCILVSPWRIVYSQANLPDCNSL